MHLGTFPHTGGGASSGHPWRWGDLGFCWCWRFRCCCVRSALHSRLSPPNFVALPCVPSKRRNKFDLEQHEHLPPSSNNSSAPNFVPSASILETRRCRLDSRTRLAEIYPRAKFRRNPTIFANGPSHVPRPRVVCVRVGAREGRREGGQRGRLPRRFDGAALANHRAGQGRRGGAVSAAAAAWRPREREGRHGGCLVGFCGQKRGAKAKDTFLMPAR